MVNFKAQLGVLRMIQIWSVAKENMKLNINHKVASSNHANRSNLVPKCPGDAYCQTITKTKSYALFTGIWISCKTLVTIGHNIRSYRSKNSTMTYITTMKMPQRWRTSRVYVTVVFAILTLFDVMTSHRRPGYKMQESNIRKWRSFNLVTLTFDLWPWLSNSSERSSMPIPVPIFRSVCQFVWPESAN